MIRAVGFDLDYTLAVPERDRAALLSEAVDRVGAPDLSRADYLDAHREHLTAETREPIFDALLPADGDADPGELAAAYRELVEDALVPVEGAEALVTRLRERYRVGLLTDGPVATQRGKLDRLGWADLFDATVVTGDLDRAKPSAAAFGELCDALGVAPADCAYVGNDPESDVEGATAAGLVPVQVIYEDSPDAHPLAAATVERDRLAAELPDVLRSLSDA